MLRQIAAWLRHQKNRLCGTPQQPEDKSRLRIMYFGTGLHYFIAARYAMISRLMPESGNLAHHALEFFLKGALLEKLDNTERRKLRHDLGRTWRRYKRERQNPALDRFDATISDLNKFERIRYPEEILRLGMRAEIGPVRSPPYKPPAGMKAMRVARYQVAFDEVDELVSLIFQIESINPAFYTGPGSLNDEARQYLNLRNNFPL